LEAALNSAKSQYLFYPRLIFAWQMSQESPLNFNNTKIAFSHKSVAELKKAKLLFNSFSYKWLLKVGPGMAKLAVFAGLKGVVKSTIFDQFCGGESIPECNKAIALLASRNVGTILDYSVEGEEEEAVFEETCEEIKRTIEIAAGNEDIPFSVFKTTGIGRFDLLEKVSAGHFLDKDDEIEYGKVKVRFESICQLAHDKNVRLFVDAEESWIQPAIDALAEAMMYKYNTESCIVYNTIQLYRKDRLAYLKHQITSKNHFLGFKLVRGAYMEKEAERAEEMGYENPIQPNKVACDKDYDLAIDVCLENIEKVSICVGTHNEKSSLHCVDLMKEKGIANDDTRIYFSQLFGMSDHISFNLSDANYKVAKYLPYGPVSSVVPYLTRRAQENSSVAGQVGRELTLINNELKSRMRS